MKRQKLLSLDDEKKKWDFQEFGRVMSELDGATTGVGGILAAMMYQIEKTNNEDKLKEIAEEKKGEDQELMVTDRPSQNRSNLNVDHSKE